MVRPRQLLRAVSRVCLPRSRAARMRPLRRRRSRTKAAPARAKKRMFPNRRRSGKPRCRRHRRRASSWPAHLPIASEWRARFIKAASAETRWLKNPPPRGWWLRRHRPRLQLPPMLQRPRSDCRCRRRRATPVQDIKPLTHQQRAARRRSRLTRFSRPAPMRLIRSSQLLRENPPQCIWTRQHLRYLRRSRRMPPARIGRDPYRRRFRAFRRGYRAARIATWRPTPLMQAAWTQALA